MPHVAPISFFLSSSLCGPNILLSTLFSNTLSLRSSLNVTDQVSHPYKTTVTTPFCLFWSLSDRVQRYCMTFQTWEHAVAPHCSDNIAHYAYCTEGNWRNEEGNIVTPLAVTPASWQPRRIDYFQASLDRITGPHFRSTTIFTPLRQSFVHQQ